MKQNSVTKLASVAILALFVSACDSIPFIDTSSDYKGSGRAKPLEVPPDLTSVQSSDAYSVPGGSTSYSTYTQAQEGQEAGVEKILPTSDAVRMEKAGAQRWLVVGARHAARSHERPRVRTRRGPATDRWSSLTTHAPAR